MDKEVFLYFIRHGRKKKAPIKIGITLDPERRLSELQIGTPTELVLVAAVPVGTEKMAKHIESSFHRAFKHQHLRGEWFHGGIHLAQFINQLEQKLASKEAA